MLYFYYLFILFLVCYVIDDVVYNWSLHSHKLHKLRGVYIHCYLRSRSSLSPVEEAWDAQAYYSK